MNILLATGIYPPEIGGPATFVRECARALAAQGHRPSVITYGDEKTKRDDPWEVTVVSRVGGSIVRYLWYAWRVFWLAHRSDVVFLQGAVSEGLPGTVGALLAGKKTVMRVPGDYAWEMYQQSNDEHREFLDEFVTHRHGGWIRLLESLERWTAGKARRVIVPSRYVGRIVGQWGVRPEALRVIYSQTPPFSETAPRDDLRRRFGCEGKIVLLTAARAVPWKGLNFLVNVLEKLSTDHVLVIAGDGPVLEDLKQQALSQGVADRCRFLGRVRRDELGEWYAAADAFVLASSYEGFPHVVVEAASAGLPCVVSDRGGNPETKDLFPGHVDVLPYGDENAWVQTLSRPFSRRAPLPLRDFAEVAQEVLQVLNDVCGS